MRNTNSSENGSAAQPDAAVVDSASYLDDGFLLFNDHLVPYSFIENLAEHLEGAVVHRVVMSAREIVGEEFWQELDIREQQVVGPVLLMLIETGRVELCRPEGH